MKDVMKNKDGHWEFAKENQVNNEVMKKFEGKVVIRTIARKINRNFLTGIHSMVGDEYDRSYMIDPIKIERVMQFHAYYCRKPNGNLELLPADYCDGNWEICHDDFVNSKWKAVDGK